MVLGADSRWGGRLGGIWFVCRRVYQWGGMLQGSLWGNDEEVVKGGFGEGWGLGGWGGGLADYKLADQKRRYSEDYRWTCSASLECQTILNQSMNAYLCSVSLWSIPPYFGEIKAIVAPS